MKLEVLRLRFKNSQIQNSMKIHSVGAELLQADRQTDSRTDMTHGVVAFRILANEPKNSVSVFEDQYLLG
jgi:hypothetical protein